MPRSRGSKYRKSSSYTSRENRSHTSKTARRKSKRRERYEKGHLFEDVAFKYFEQLGYNVSKNVVKTGFSGARHEIDLLIEKNGVLGIVEVKNYKRPIPKEWIMKAYNVARDIGATEAYVVSAKGFTEGAIKTAEILNVKLLDLDYMAKEVRRKREAVSVNKGFMEPVYDKRRAKEYAFKFATKKLFKRVEEPGSIELLYLPVYLTSGVHKYYEEEGLLFKKYIERYERKNILVDSIKGRLLTYSGDCIEFIDLPRLTDNEKTLLQIIMGYESISYWDLLDETGWSRQKLSRVLRSLLDKEVIDLVDEEDEEEEYYSLIPDIDELDETASTIMEDSEPLFGKGLPRGGRILDIGIDVNSFKPFLKDVYEFTIKDYRLVYLPLYRVVMRKISGKAYRYLYLAAWIDEPVRAVIEL